MRRFPNFALCVSVLAVVMPACASTAEQAARDEVSAQAQKSSTKDRSPAPTASERAAPHPSSKNDSKSGLSRYTALAREESPELEAAFERWRASAGRISRSRRLPDPTISFGYFVSSVETRVGPQRARIGIQQSFPWPSGLTAGADAASAQARAEQEKFEALASVIRGRVAAAYYRLWFLRKTRQTHAEHLEVVRSLSESVLARLATGTSSLADQQQVDLTAARLEDRLKGVLEDEKAAVAQLRAAVGSRDLKDFDTPHGPPDALLPSESDQKLEASAKEHPLLRSLDHIATSHEEQADAKESEGLPSFTLSADWIITDKSATPDVDGSGKDAFIVGGAMSVPLWRGSYSDSADADRAEASAARSERAAAENRAVAEVQTALSRTRDAARRVKLYQHTLVPQAESAYSSVLGAYATGRGTVAQTLLAQKDLLELRGELERARADHALAWARLEQVVGREVHPAKQPPSEK